MRRRLRLAAALLLAAATVGCSGLPESGEVQFGEGTGSSAVPAPFDFNPPGPVAGATPTQVVSGFLRALQATPVSIAVAEDYLTEDSAQRWRPGLRTVVYAGQQSRAVRTGQDADAAARRRIHVDLVDAFALDRHGRWAGEVGRQGVRTLAFTLVREGGEWRIVDPPNAMVVPQGHFETRYRRLAHFFFDASGQVLVPEPVYLPIGPQTATLLVAGLLDGPVGAAARVDKSFLPEPVGLGGSVAVEADGAAVVPFGAGIAALDEDTLDRALAQLAWTLRQVPEIGALRLTVDGRPLDLPRGASQVNVDGWAEYSPSLSPSPTDLFGVRAGQVVQVAGGEEVPVVSLANVPGERRPRSVSVDVGGQRVAVVPSDGASVQVLPRSTAEEPPAPTAVYTGTDVLRPVWDRTGLLWMVDRTSAGDRVQVISEEETTVLAPPEGFPGRAVAATLSRDGSRLVVATARSAASAGQAEARLWVMRVVRRADGTPTRLTGPEPMPALQPLRAVAALGWRDPTTVAVLTRPTRDTSQVVPVNADGSSGRIALEDIPDLLFDAGVDLAAAPGGQSALVVATRTGRLHALNAQGRWDLDTLPQGLRRPAYAAG